ncbi:hypothetical protein WA026_014382 [Henosepilachna vigintioctopunctata]|uniref:Uncharacterized protein n=1 Tax=Henosepilachna vigintioctopunctata TaxID=420089 RepID=A0AAW1UNM1_9CUCU
MLKIHITPCKNPDPYAQYSVFNDSSPLQRELRVSEWGNIAPCSAGADVKKFDLLEGPSTGRPNHRHNALHCAMWNTVVILVWVGKSAFVGELTEGASRGILEWNGVICTTEGQAPVSKREMTMRIYRNPLNVEALPQVLLSIFSLNAYPGRKMHSQKASSAILLSASVKIVDTNMPQHSSGESMIYQHEIECVICCLLKYVELWSTALCHYYNQFEVVRDQRSIGNVYSI